MNTLPSTPVSMIFFIIRHAGPVELNTQEVVGDSEKSKSYWLSLVQLFATPWTVAHQAPLSLGFSKQEYWSGLPFLSPGDLLDPGIEPRSPALQADSLLYEPPG